MLNQYSGEEARPQDEDRGRNDRFLGANPDALPAEVCQQRGDGDRCHRGVRGSHGHERVLECAGACVQRSADRLCFENKFRYLALSAPFWTECPVLNARFPKPQRILIESIFVIKPNSSYVSDVIIYRVTHHLETVIGLIMIWGVPLARGPLQ